VVVPSQALLRGLEKRVEKLEEEKSMLVEQNKALSEENQRLQEYLKRAIPPLLINGVNHVATNATPVNNENKPRPSTSGWTASIEDRISSFVGPISRNP
jgi:hypothetical protein